MVCGSLASGLYSLPNEDKLHSWSLYNQEAMEQNSSKIIAMATVEADGHLNIFISKEKHVADLNMYSSSQIKIISL